MLVMATSQSRYPITFFVLMKTNDGLLHGNVIEDCLWLGSKNGHATDMPASYYIPNLFLIALTTASLDVASMVSSKPSLS